jgi:serine/threonine protein kinase
MIQVQRPPEAIDQTTSCPRYRILDLIGRGGMGSIYRAWDSILDRPVAIKMVLENHLTPELLQRFHHEAYVIAQLQHPSIPPIYDIGTMEEPPRDPSTGLPVDEPTYVNGRTPDRAASQASQRRPYLAMKLVQGETLEKLLLEHGRGSSLWLPVFESICQAVGYAHEAGFVHRDLKPANVMVGSFGEVQVMDWGLSKRLPDAIRCPGVSNRVGPSNPTPPGTWKSLLADDCRPGEPVGSANSTEIGTILGTPSYMSPEQARGEIGSVDRRSDVFALGVILFEMLTGEELQKGDSREVIVGRASGDFAASIERLDKCGEDPTVIALAKRCLEMDPDRRPANAEEVAQAVARLRSEAETRAKNLELKQVEASLREVELRKRRRVLAVSFVVVVAVLVAGITVSTVMAWKARVAEANAKASAAAEQAANNLTQKQMSAIQNSNDLLLGVFEDLDIREVREGRMPVETLLADRLAAAGKALDAEAVLSRVMLASLQHRLGVTLLHLGRARDASELLERAGRLRTAELGEDSPESIDSRNKYGEAIAADGRVADAVAVFNTILPRALAAGGEGGAETISIHANLINALQKTRQYDRAIAIGESAYETARKALGPAHHETLTIRNNLANVYTSQNKPELAVRLFSDSLETLSAKYGMDHVFTILTLNNLGAAYNAMGQPGKCLEYYRDATIRATRTLGLDHPETWLCMNNLAFAHKRNNEWEPAIQIYEQLLKLKTGAYGRHHQLTYRTREQLAECYIGVSRHASAVELLELLLPWWKVQHGDDHPTVVKGLDNLSDSYLKLNQPAQALPYLKTLVAVRRVRLGARHEETLNALGKLARCQYGLKDFVAATPLFEELSRELSAAKGANDGLTISALDHLSVCYVRIGNIVASIPVCESVLAYRRANLGLTNIDTMNVLERIVMGHYRMGNFAAMEPLAEELVRSYETAKGKTHVETFQKAVKLGEAYRGNRRTALAVEYFEKTLRLATDSLGPNHEVRLDCMNSLAAAYLDADRLGQARDLFHETFKQLAKAIGEDDHLTQVALLNYATCSHRMGLKDQAMAAYDELIAMYGRRRQPGNLDFGMMLGQAGYILLEMGEYGRAERFCRESLAIRERLQPDAWSTFSMRSMLGGALLGQRKYDESEPLLLSGFEEMQKRSAQIPALGLNRLFDGGQRLATLYDATGRPDKAQAVRGKLGREMAPAPRSSGMNK